MSCGRQQLLENLALGICRQCHEAPALISPKGAMGQLGMSWIRSLLLCFCTSSVRVIDTSSTSYQSLVINGERRPGAPGQVLGLASLSGKEQLVDSTRRVNAVSLPLDTLCPQDRLLPGHLLSRSEAVFFEAGGPSWLPFAHLATMGLCYCLKERGTRGVHRY